MAEKFGVNAAIVAQLMRHGMRRNSGGRTLLKIRKNYNPCYEVLFHAGVVMGSDSLVLHEWVQY